MIEVGARPPIRYAVAIGVDAGNPANLNAGGARTVDHGRELDVKLRIGDGVGEDPRQRFVLATGHSENVEIGQYLLVLDEDVEDAAVGDIGTRLRFEQRRLVNP